MKVLTSFFSEKSHPFNLALMRIILFGTLLFLPKFYPVEWFADFPEALRFRPYGYYNWAYRLPGTAEWIKLSAQIYYLICVLGIFGVGTRIVSWLCVVLGFYVLIVPHYFGKVAHYHAVYWGLLIFAACTRNHDYFSIDSIFSAIRKADKGDVSPPKPARVYAIPIRFMYLYMGVAYFFAGFWKLAGQGPAWFLGDNLQRQLWAKWLDWGGWLPLFRVDQYPILYKTSGFLVCTFELVFIFMILFPFLRPFAFVGGLMFHQANVWLIRIPFWYMQVFYPILFDCEKIMAWIGKKMFRESAYVIYDGGCKLCRRTVAIIRRFDIFDRIQYVAIDQNRQIQPLRKFNLSEEEILRDMHAVYGEKVLKGFDAYRLIAARVPIFWILWPFLYLFPVAWAGKKIYRSVADARTCEIKTPEGREISEEKSSHKILILWGLLIFLGAVHAGILNYHSWPFSVYPTFHEPLADTRRAITMEAYDESGNIIPYDDFWIREKFYPTRLRMLHEKILRGEKEIPEQLIGLWQVWCVNLPELENARSVKFYKDTQSIFPQDFPRNPIERSLLAEARKDGESCFDMKILEK